MPEGKVVMRVASEVQSEDVSLVEVGYRPSW
jgi:hypothetical protein